MKERDIEIYVGYSDNTWDTFVVSMPINTSEELLENIAMELGRTRLFNNPNTRGEVAFMRVYHISPIKEDEI